MTLKIPFEIITKSKNIKIMESTEFDKRQVLANSDIKPLLLPSEQDCTKSSLGHINHSVSINEDLKIEKKHSIYRNHEVLLIANNLIKEKEEICHLQKTKFFRHSDLVEMESACSEPESGDKEPKFNEDKPVENNCCRIALNNSLKAFSGQVKQQLKSVSEENCLSQSVPHLSCGSQSSSNENESDNEINNDGKVKKILKSRRLRNNRRKIASDYSLEVISDQVKEERKIIQNKKNESSDGDDIASVQFSQVFVNADQLDKNGSTSNITSNVLHNSLIDNFNSKFVNYCNESHRSHSIHFSETGMYSNKNRHVCNNYTSQEMHNSLVNNLYGNFVDNGSESDSDGSVVFSNTCTHNAPDDDDNLKIKILPHYIDVSDSDDSIVFSKSYTGNHHENEKLQQIVPNFEIDFDESDSDDSIEFLETYLHKKCDYEPLTDYGFVNPCFEDNDYLLDCNRIKIINNNWSITMKDISSEPREAKKVSFLPLPNLVSVQTFEPEEDGYCYSLYVLNQIRFKNLIADIEMMLTPYLTKEYRSKFYQRNYQCEK